LSDAAPGAQARSVYWSGSSAQSIADGPTRQARHCDLAAAAARRSVDTEGRWRDSMIWTLLRDDYDASPARDVRITACDCLGQRLL
jgi:hypothetical protein